MKYIVLTVMVDSRHARVFREVHLDGEIAGEQSALFVLAQKCGRGNALTSKG